MNKFCFPIYLLGYNVPTRVAPKFVLRCLALFDGSIKMILPQIGEEAHFDNSKVMYAVKSIIFDGVLFSAVVNLTGVLLHGPNYPVRWLCVTLNHWISLRADTQS